MKIYENRNKLYSSLVLGAFLVGGLTGCDAGMDEWDEDESGYIDENEFESTFSQVNYYNGWDSDNDGFLNESELHGGVFVALDEDNNNMLDENEWDAYGSIYNETQDREIGDFEDWDMDNDDSITNEEFLANNGEMFDYNQWDSNQDNQLDNDEFNKGIFSLWDADGNDQIDDGEFGVWEKNFISDEAMSMTDDDGN